MALGVGSGTTMQQDLDALGKAFEKTTAVMAEVIKNIQAISGKGATPPPGAKEEKAPAAGGGISDMMSGLTGSVQTAIGALRMVPDAVLPFVQAFNPQLIELLNQTIANLQATVGAAFEPLIEILNDLGQQVNDVIAPVFEELRPVIEELARAAAERLMPIIKLLAEVAEPLVSAMAILAENFRALQEILPMVVSLLRAFVAVVVGIAESFGNVFEDMKGINDQLVSAMKAATKAIIVFVANMAKMFGLDGVVDSLKKTFGQKDDKGKVAGAKDVGITDFGNILREAQVAAFAAQGGGAKGTEDWLEGISKLLEDGIANQQAFEDRFVKAANVVLEKVGLKLAIEDVKAIREAIVGAKVAAPRALKNASIPASVQTVLDALGI